MKRTRISLEGLWAPDAKVFSDFFAFSLTGSGIPEYKVPDGTVDQDIIQTPGEPRGDGLFSEAAPEAAHGGRVSFAMRCPWAHCGVELNRGPAQQSQEVTSVIPNLGLSRGSL